MDDDAVFDDGATAPARRRSRPRRPGARTALRLVQVLGAAAALAACGGRSHRAAGAMVDGPTPTAAKVVASSVYRQVVGATRDAAVIERLTASIDRLRAHTTGGWQVRQDDTSGMAGVVSGGAFMEPAGTAPLVATQDFLQRYGDLFGMTDASVQVAFPDALAVDAVDTAALRTVQVVRGVPVDGSELVVVVRHAATAPEIDYAAGHLFPDVQVGTEPVVAKDAAAALAAKAAVTVGGEPSLVVYTGAAAPVLAWRVDGVFDPPAGATSPIERGVVSAFFDAGTGQLLEIRQATSMTLAAATSGQDTTAPTVVLPPAGTTVQITGLGTSGYQLTVTAERLADGTIAFIDASEPSADRVTGADVSIVYDATGLRDESGLPGKIATMREGATPDPDTLTAAWAAKQVLAYYRTEHGRRSFDGAGAPLVSSVHVASVNCNAFFTPQLRQMVYGAGCVDPNGRALTPSMVDIGVVGHEITHGVTNTNTPMLHVSAQGSALNEATSDYFGIIVQDRALGQPYTTVGVVICIDAQPSGTCRPFSDGQKGIRSVDTGATFDDFEFRLRDMFGPLDQLGDSGGQHANAIVWTNALWKIRRGFAAEDGGDMVRSASASKFDRAVYRALTIYFTNQIDFAQAAADVVQAASDLPDITAVERSLMINQFLASGFCAGCATPPGLRSPVAVSDHIDYRPQVTTAGVVYLDESTRQPMLAAGGNRAPVDLAPAGVETVNVVAAGHYAFDSEIDPTKQTATLVLRDLLTGRSEAVVPVPSDSYAQATLATPAISTDSIAWTTLASDRQSALVNLRAIGGGPVVSLAVPDEVIALGVDRQVVGVQLIDGSIVVWDAASGKASLIATAPQLTQQEAGPLHFASQIVVSGRRLAALVPSPASDGSWLVYVYDAATGRGGTVSQTAFPAGLTLDGDTLIWAETAGAQTSGVAKVLGQEVAAVNLWGYSFKTNVEAIVVAERGQQGFPSLAGGVLAWQDSVSGGDDIYTENLPAF